MKLSGSGMLTFGIIFYPVTAHIAVHFEKLELVMWYFVVVGLCVTLFYLYEKSWSGFIGGLLVLLSLLYLWWQYSTGWLIFVPAVLIFAALGYYFGRTLLAGRTPLITTIATTMATEPLDVAQQHYTKMVTVVWTVFFCIMCIESVLLAVFAPLHVWSTMTNIVNYIIVASMFVIEFVVRKRLVKQDRFESFYHFISTMLKKRHEIRQKLR